jgi:formiminoglutamate deiminase
VTALRIALPWNRAGRSWNDVSVNAVRRWHAELAWLDRGTPDPDGLMRPDELARDVLIEASGERITAVTPGTPAAGLPPDVTRLPGLTLPGLANAHSHAFHRALRGLTEIGRAGGTFWTWRERMYEVASRLSPETYYDLARAVFAEMALAGISCVGEFHYVHHDSGGKPYSDLNVLGRSLIAAASAAGIRITLLDTCYLASGFAPGGEALPLAGVQLRFGDGSASRWAARLAEFGCDSLGMVAPHARLGAAIHSVRAVPPDQMPEVMSWSHAHAAPVHVHLSEQPRENEECVAAFGGTPSEVLSGAGVLGPRSTMVHATHLAPSDISLLGASGVTVCMCPVTEADLADGVGPSPALAAAGCGLSLGSDGHSVIDLFEEARWLELSQRYVTRQRGHFTPGELAGIATAGGHGCLGWPDAGAIVPGAYADLVTVSLHSPRLAGGRVTDGGVAGGWVAGGGIVGSAAVGSGAVGGGAGEGALGRLFAAGTASDVRNMVVSGRDVVRDGHHLLVNDVGSALSAAISAVTDLPVLATGPGARRRNADG